MGFCALRRDTTELPEVLFWILKTKLTFYFEVEGEEKEWEGGRQAEGEERESE